MKTFCYIPAVCIKPDEEIAQQVRRQLALALENKVVPSGLPAGLTGIAIDIADEQLKPVKAFGAALKQAPGRIIGGLMYAMHLHGARRAETTAPEPVLTGLRPGQSKCLQEVAPLLSTGKIVLSEAGTGSGKARLLAHAAQFAIQLRDAGTLPSIGPVSTRQEDQGELPLWIRQFAAVAQAVLSERREVLPDEQVQRAVILCAPSIENVAHLVREWSACAPVLDPKGLLKTTVVLGRGQFVSSSLLAEAISASDPACDTTRVQQWLADGMPAGYTQSTRHLQKLDSRLCGLMADLEALSQEIDFPYQNAALDDDCPDCEQLVYRDLRDSAMTSDIVFTTHAMLCLDSIQLCNADAQPLLPLPAAVFVDEAHLLESIQASVAAKSLSLSRLSVALHSEFWSSHRKDTAVKAVAAAIKRVTNAMVDIPHETAIPVSEADGYQVVAAWQAAQVELADLSKQLAGLLKLPKGVKPTADQGRALKYVEKAVRTLESIRKDYKGYIEHSPVRSQISFNVGPSSVEKYLCARWATTPCAVLTSGTLLHIGASGGSAAPISRDLAIPIERCAATIPMHPSWIVETPRLLMPSVDSFHRFVPPTGDQLDDEAAMKYWLHECSKVVALAAEDAVGGILVLMTGYDRLGGLAESLAGYPDLAGRLIVQSKVQRVSVCASAFKDQARKGVRPIWLATGAAWTGLDLADETVRDDEVEKDLLLTDLIIPNLPFGLVRTTTHVARTSRIGFAAEAIVTQRQFRQGIGRLVRREGLLHRRIWLIDGRLQHPSAAAYMSDFRRVLLPYIHREPFNV